MKEKVIENYNEEELIEKYNWDYKNSKTYNTRVGHYKYRCQFNFIVENGKNHFDKILDVAGGSGRMAIPLTNYSNDITVIDIKPIAIKLLKNRNNKINTICDDFISRNFFNKKFSLILCIEAIDHFRDKKLFLKKIYNLIDINGKFIFVYTNPNSWRFLLWKIKHLKNNKRLKFESLQKILCENNLEIEKIKGMNWMPLPLNSNSIFVSFFEVIEKKFRLYSWYSQSPWLLISVKRKD